MVESAVLPFRAVRAFQARFRLVIQRVVLSLLPPVALLAGKVVWATFLVVHHEFQRLPVRARIWVVLDFVRGSTEVLPIVGVHTQCLIVFSEVKRAPHRLEMEHVEVSIILQVVDQLNRYVLLTVGK